MVTEMATEIIRKKHATLEAIVFTGKLSTTVLRSTHMVGNKHACCAVTGLGLIVQMYCINN